MQHSPYPENPATHTLHWYHNKLHDEDPPNSGFHLFTYEYLKLIWTIRQGVPNSAASVSEFF